MSRIEELFEKKLADHAVEPGPQVWDKIEAGLSKKNKGVVWLRWAAIFLMGGLLFGTLWLTGQRPETQLAKKEIITTPEKEQDVKKQVLPVAENKVESTVKKKPKQVRPQPREEKKETVQETTSDKTEATTLVLVEAPVKVVPAVETDKQIVLVYKLESVETQEHDNTVAIVPEKKEGLKKVMQFALDVKNGESPFGLREAKDELFALDLKNKNTKKH